jgi:hypothetical protein
MATNNLILHMQVKFVYAQTAFDFKVEGKIETAIFEYKYYPTTRSIEYLDIRYTNLKLQSLIENNSKMMKNIDSYIKELFLEKKDNHLDKRIKDTTYISRIVKLLLLSLSKIKFLSSKFLIWFGL